MDRLSNSLLITVAGVTLTGLTLLAVSHPVLRAFLAVPLVLVWPGFVAVIALFPQHKVEVSSRLLFSIGLSMGLTALAGLLLTWTPWGLQLSTWVAYLGTGTLCAGILAWVRRPVGFKLAAAEGMGLDLRQIVIFGLAGLVFAMAIIVARTPAPPLGLEGYTVFWLQPAGRTRPNEASLGISNMEFGVMAYRLQLELDDRLIHEWPVIELESGQTWEYKLVLRGENVGESGVEARLYHLDVPEQVYRRVVWWPETPGEK